MKGRNNLLGGFSLPTVLVISTLMALLLLAALSAVDLENRNYSLYHRDKQRILDIHSAVARFNVDSALVSPGDSVPVPLFGEEESGVNVSLSRWGLYELATFSNVHTPIRLSYIVGRENPCLTDAALYVCDRNRPLTFAGNTAVEGVICIPRSGVNYADIPGKPFTGREIADGDLRVSEERLPSPDNEVLLHLDSLSSLRDVAWYHLNIADRNCSYRDNTVFAYGRDSDGMFDLKGRMILYADRLRIGACSSIDGILVFARSVVLEDGFEGRLQIFCTDSITVGRNVRLRFPSGVFVSDSVSHPCITMLPGSRISGYAVSLTGGRQDLQIENPAFRQSAGSLVEGLLYVDGTALLRGDVSGSAYVRDCFYEDVDYGRYPGVLCDCHFSRAEDMAFPMLLRGYSRRKEIMKVY